MSMLVDTVTGAGSGAVGGLFAGMAAAFCLGYFLSIAQMFDASARLALARTNVVFGALMGGIIGLLMGAITGGSGSLLVGLLVAAMLATALFLVIRQPGKPVIMFTFVVFCGGVAGSLAAIAGIRLVATIL